MRLPLLRKYDEYLITWEGMENNMNILVRELIENTFRKSLMCRDFPDGELSPSVPQPPFIYQSPRSKLLWFQQFICFPESLTATLIYEVSMSFT